MGVRVENISRGCKSNLRHNFLLEWVETKITCM